MRGGPTVIMEQAQRIRGLALQIWNEWSFDVGQQDGLAVRELGQLGLSSQRGAEEEERQDMERPWTLGELVIVMTGPSDRDWHAPVELQGVKESGQSSTCRVRSNTQVMDLLHHEPNLGFQVQHFQNGHK